VNLPHKNMLQLFGCQAFSRSLKLAERTESITHALSTVEFVPRNQLRNSSDNTGDARNLISPIAEHG
jgi:hypothetical protein